MRSGFNTSTKMNYVIVAYKLSHNQGDDVEFWHRYLFRLMHAFIPFLVLPTYKRKSRYHARLPHVKFTFKIIFTISFFTFSLRLKLYFQLLEHINLNGNTNQSTNQGLTKFNHHGHDPNSFITEVP